MSSTSPLRVMHLLYSLEMGGAQKVVANLVKHHDRKAFIPVVGSMIGVGPLEELIRRAGAEVVHFDKKPGIDLGVAFRLRDYIRKNDIRVVNAHNFTASLWGRIACAGLKDVAFVVTEHGRVGITPKKLRFINRILAGGIDRIIAVNEETSEFVKSIYPYNARKVRVVVNGIDVPESPGWSKEQLTAEFGIPSDSRVIVNVAAHTPVKDHSLLIRAFKILSGEIPGARLLLIGDGPLRGDLEKLVAESGLGDRVVFAGMRIDGPDIIAACDVFCLSSRVEGTSIAALEAMARSCPVVLTAVGGNPNIVIDQVEGLLVRHGNEELLAGALKRILMDREFASNLTKAALKKIETDFSAGVAAGSTEAVYSEALNLQGK